MRSLNTEMLLAAVPSGKGKKKSKKAVEMHATPEREMLEAGLLNNPFGQFNIGGFPKIDTSAILPGVGPLNHHHLAYS